MTSGVSSGRHTVPSCATTLHVTLLTSHYASAHDREDNAVPPGSNSAAAGHRRDAPPSSKANSSTNAKVAGGEGVEVYSCSTVADHLDTVARVLCAVLRLQNSACDDAVADAARCIQTAKAVRDDVVPWANVAAAAALAQEKNPLPHDGLSPFFSSAASTLPSHVTTPPSTASGTKKGRGRYSLAAKDGGKASSPQHPGTVKSPLSVTSTPSLSSLPGVQNQTSEAEQGPRQLYLRRELPPCEVVLVPGASPTSAQSYVIFVYHLAHEEDVLAALLALSAEEPSSSADKKDAQPSVSPESSRREKSNTQSSQAAEILTQALWSTVEVVLPTYPHVTGGRPAPAHVPVVWALADPRMLRGFLPCTLDDTDDIFSFYPCPFHDPMCTSSSMCRRDEAAAVKHLVRLVPRSVFYLYDPSSSSIVVKDTLAAFQPRPEEKSHSQESSHSAAPRLSCNESIKKCPTPQRGGVRSPAGAGAKSARVTGPASSGPGSSRGRNVRGAAGAVGASANHASVLAASGPHRVSLQSRFSNGGVDMQAAPDEFPYCTTNPRSLAQYLYSGGLGATAAAPSPQVAASVASPPSPADLEMELTCFLNKMAAFQRAVTSLSEAGVAASKTNETVEEMWRTHASLLTWVRAYLSCSADVPLADRSAAVQGINCTDGESRRGYQQPPLAFEEVVRLSLSRCLPKDSMWPLPLWEVAPLPIAPVPPLTLRSSGSDDVAVSTNMTVESIVPWANAVLSTLVGDDDKTAGSAEANSRAPFVPLLSRLVHLIDAYNTWSSKNRLTPTRVANNDCHNRTCEVVVAGKAPGDHAPDGTLMVPPSMASGLYTGGVFNIMSAVCVWVATVSTSLAHQQSSSELTALCVSEESLASSSATGPTGSRVAIAPSAASSGLFRRYAQPFQVLQIAGNRDEKTRMGSGALAAVVPRLYTATETPINESAATHSGKRLVMTTSERIHSQSADVALPPYPQEVSWMVRHVIAKNAGHFEVNVMRGTDTVTPPTNHQGLCPMMQDLATGGSPSTALHQSTIATMTTTTKSVGHLLQQQRRRLLRHMSGVATKLQPYSQGVHLIKEVARDFLGRRPITETSVTLQEAVESTLAAPRSQTAAGKRCSGSVGTSSRRDSKQHRGESVDTGATGTQQVSALNLLQRYLVSVDPTHARLATKSKLVKPKNPALLVKRHRSNESNENQLLAARAAAENLMPQIYEHVLQQALLHQLLRETGLESAAHPTPAPHHGHLPTAVTEDAASANDDWSITQQLPVQAIVTSIVDFRERFGAHNVAWRSCAFHYRPLPLPTAMTDTITDRGVNSGAFPEEAADDGVYRTSAYAHNALNVHPTRRVTHMWIAGVAVPNAQMAKGGTQKGLQSHSDAKGGQSRCLSLGRQRSRRWVVMVPRAGAVTPVEVYALWQSLLQEQSEQTANVSDENRIIASVADSAAQLRVGPAELKMRAMHRLIAQYMQSHAEASTSLVRGNGMPSAFPEKTSATDGAPMRFDTHETLYPYGDAVVEVWMSEVQRLCRYIKATEVIATLHAAPSSKEVTNMHLTVHWDDGLLLTCTSGRGGRSGPSTAPPTDVLLTTCNTVLERREGVSRIRFFRYPNTSSSTMAGAAVSLKELSGQQTPILPQGGVMETCTALLEEPVTLYCVHHCPPRITAATVVELEGSSEEETVCEVDERTGVVHRFYASGKQQLLFPSGAMMVRRPMAPVHSKSTQHYCDTLITLDGRCFVRNDSTRDDTFADAPLQHSTGAPPAVFQCVQARMARASCVGTKGGTGIDDTHAPPFTHMESTYDAVYHCHMRSRQDGLTVAEYESLSPHPDSEVTHHGARAASKLARVVVFPDGTTITTVAPREARRRALVHHSNGTSVLASLSSPTLCALLEEVQAVEESLLRSVGDRAELSVRWCVEASVLPRVYLAPAQRGGGKEGRERVPAFAVVFGDGTVLQRRWVAAVMPPIPFTTTGTEVDALANAGKSNGSGAGGVEEGGPHGIPAYTGGTFETVLTRPSTSAVRILHQHAIATIEPADVLAAITHASPAAYAVGQGLVFFDLACGGGLRLVDAARCVWEVRGLAAPEGPEVLHPERASTYQELLQALVSPHYSPHRLPRAVQMMYAREQEHENAAYVQRRATGWCPTLPRRMREIAEPFIRTAQLLRTDVLAPIESAAAAAEERFFGAGGALSKPPSATVKEGSSTATRDGSSLTSVVPERLLRVFPVCFGQLDNGEAIRYWHVSEVPPLLSGSRASLTPIAASEPQVIERLVPGIATGSVLGYISTAPGHTHDADAIGTLFCGQPSPTSGSRSVLWKRLVSVARLSLLCAGILAPAIPPAIRPPCAVSFLSAQDTNTADVMSLPSLAVLLNRGSRWLPPTLQPPQQFGTYQERRRVGNAGAEIGNANVAWVRDSPAALSNAAVNAAYVEYVLEQVSLATAVTTSCAALQREVVRKELHRHEQLAQLSHYHRVLSTQWPMELPASAREEQVRLEMRFEDLQRNSRSTMQTPARRNNPPPTLVSSTGDPGTIERMAV
ncbi:hypothetical protein JKF63_01059 [Porcisia hertigi]|uniref:Uncharacterized protein n=1 Tax=Porcisia hertigi TaxID=2761500 RepID=A0A836HFS6_9TRYP|nr:hypothetical protein JKF63_01059 [Porcisia hertigi]